MVDTPAFGAWSEVGRLRRVLVCALCFVWAGVELSQGSVGWALLFAACGIYLVIQFFVLFDPADYEAKPDTPTERTDS